ncbi:MAG: very short patch repair endonuclease [Pseudomonas fluorescens]|uniref:very short patch repair endonuclease n=1 Tax=Agrobacterium pusense TaxID=648995 RepID=UPI000DB4754B|nr:very short patch repair endonuclease [Agrobacterium pusense]MDH1271212.1 very short patch repair endonuclease [Agrobacterium pusense]PZP39351.1 MAG: very short patch repair endonuclease [Pseudomonas fluorescens]
MADVVPPEVRSRMMAGIRGKNTMPELLVRRALHAEGFRYRLHDAKLPGKPDMVFPKHRAAVFVHGCFWHGHDCHLFRLPATRPEFWLAKIQGNVARDGRAIDALRQHGWRVGTVWECALKGRTRMPAGEVSAHLAEWLRSDSATFEAEGLKHD